MKKLFIFMFAVLFISLTSASISNLGTFKQDTDIELIQTCSSCSYNNITTIKFGNGTVLTINDLMTSDGSYYSYNFSSNFTNTLGTYIVNGMGDLEGVDTVWNYNFVVTPTGKIATTPNAIITFLAVLLFFILGVVSFMGSSKQSKTPIKWTLGLLGFIFFLAGLNLISVIIPDALINENVVTFFDGFTAISFIMFWFASGLIAIMWILTFFQTVFYKRNLKAAEKYG